MKICFVKKRTLAALLTICMVLSMSPISASAQEVPLGGSEQIIDSGLPVDTDVDDSYADVNTEADMESDGDIDVKEPPSPPLQAADVGVARNGFAMSIDPSHAYVVGENSYATLGEALDAVPSGGTISLTKSTTHTSPVLIANKNITFDLTNGSLAIDVSTDTALTVRNGSVVTLTGNGTLDVKGPSGGVYAYNATVTVRNAVATSGTGAYALDGGDITVLGNATGLSPGAFAFGPGSIVTVKEDATTTGAGSNAVDVANRGRVVAKNAIATGANSSGVRATDFGSVLISQNVQGVANGVRVESKGEIEVGGNVTADGTNSVGALAYTGGTITIDGSITAKNYVKVGGTTKTNDQITTPTTLTGYNTYTDETSTVWVKDTGLPGTAQTITAAAESGSPVAGTTNIITFKVKNAAGEIDTTFTGSHEVTLSGAQVMTGGTTCGLFASDDIPDSGTLTTDVLFSEGMATSSLSLFKAGAQTIGFCVAGVTNPSASVDFTVVPDALGKMELTQNITAPNVNGGQFAQQPRLELKDSYNNLYTNDSATQITASKEDTGSWTLTGTTIVTAVNGVVTFTDLGATNAAQVTGAQLKFTASVSVNDSISAAVTLPAPIVLDDVCEIDEIGYPALGKAITAALNAGGATTITLLQSIDEVSPITVDSADITFALGSFDLSIDTNATAGSAALTVQNGGKVSCSGSGKLNVKGSRYGVKAEGGSEIHVSGSVTAGQYGVYTASGGSGKPKVTVDGDVTVTGQVASSEVEAITAGGYATVLIGGHVTANRASYTQIVTAVYANGSTITIGKDVTTQGSGVNVLNDGKVTIEGALTFNPTGSGAQSYIKLGYPVVIKTADDFEDTSTKPNYKEYKNGDNIVWLKDAAQLDMPTGLAWDTSAEQLKATWIAVPHANQYKVEYYKDGSKLGMSTNVNSPNTATDNIKDNLLVWGEGDYTFTVQATGSSYTDSFISQPSDPYSYTPGETTYLVTVNGSYASLTGAGSYATGSTVSIYAGNRAGHTFAGWSSDHVAIRNAGQKNASFAMPSKAVTLTANWSYNGGGGSSYTDASLSATKADFDQFGGKDVTITLNRGSYTLNDLKNGSYILKKETDYTISGSTIAIKAGYLDSLAAGKQIITFDMSGGTDPILTITSIDKTNPDTDAQIPFEDVTVDDWFMNNVMWAFDSGLMKGVSVKPMMFAPHSTTTRGMLVTILYRLEGTPEAGTTIPFADVADGKWYKDAIVWAAENKIVIGYGNGRFGPDDPITREQMAVILMNYAKLKGYDVSASANLSGFTDADIVSGWALKAMRWANAASLISGDGAKMKPRDKTERCQVAAILQRFIENITK